MHNWDNPSTWVILLVDDEIDNLEVVTETLMFFGATVKTAANGTVALDLLETYSPTLIVTDLSMPVMDGWQLRKRIKELPGKGDIPIMALTAHAMLGDKERALNAGFEGYITKPINVLTLVQDIKAVAKEQILSRPTKGDVPSVSSTSPGTPASAASNLPPSPPAPSDFVVLPTDPIKAAVLPANSGSPILGFRNEGHAQP